MKKLGLIARNKGHPRLKFSPQKQAAQTAGTSGEQLVHSPASVHTPAWQTQRCGIDRLGLLLLDFPAPAWGSEGLCSRPFLPSVPPAVPEWGLLPSSVRRRVGPALRPHAAPTPCASTPSLPEALMANSSALWNSHSAYYLKGGV